MQCNRPKLAPLYYFTVLRQTILLIKGEPLGGKGLKITTEVHKILLINKNVYIALR